MKGVVTKLENQLTNQMRQYGAKKARPYSLDKTATTTIATTTIITMKRKNVEEDLERVSPVALLLVEVTIMTSK